MGLRPNEVERQVKASDELVGLLGKPSSSWDRKKVTLRVERRLERPHNEGGQLRRSRRTGRNQDAIAHESQPTRSVKLVPMA